MPWPFLFSLLPSLCFGGRFFIQWILSERYKQSVVPKSFWYLSLIGNVLLGIHYISMSQGVLALLQLMNGAIAWRNLNLFRPRPWSLPSFLLLFFALMGSMVGWMMYAMTWWPSLSLDEGTVISWEWHLFGSACAFLFASRFWFQWIASERQHRSQLPTLFWVLSLAGSGLSLIYFVKIEDKISLLYAVLGMFPYLRNLILITQKKNRAYTIPSAAHAPE